MFSGIVTEIGEVKSVRRGGQGLKLDVSCINTFRSVRSGDSVAVNGVCLTVSGKTGSLCFDVVNNTALNTNLKRLKPGDRVNIENALKLGDNISGHLVSGHVDGERRVIKNYRSSRGWVLEVKKLASDKDLLMRKGSVALDGVSLTVAEISPSSFSVYLIPYTLNDTTISTKRSGDYINVEYDMVGKYGINHLGESRISIESLKDKGFF